MPTSPVHWEEPRQPTVPHLRRTALLVNLAAVLERCDEQMLPAVYRFIGATWSATPTQLGYITLCRALVQALSSPLGGIAGQFLHRGRVVGGGCLLFACCTAVFAGCHSLAAGAAVWAVNGLGLALVLPSSQSLVADCFASAQRGRAFGLLYFTGALGGMVGALYATNMGAHRPLGLEGWRFAFLSLAVVSAAAGVANLLLTEDPQRQQQQQHGHREGGPAGAPLVGKASEAAYKEAAVAAEPAGPDEGARGSGHNSERQPLASWRAGVSGSGQSSGSGGGGIGLEAPGVGKRVLAAVGGPAPSLRDQARGVLRDVAAVLRIPTFIIIVAQGIFGSVPWSALVFLTLYLQLLGMSDAQASSLVALFLAGTAVGGLIGGCVGDAAAKYWPHHGRIAVTQFSVSIGIPFAFLVFKGLPRDGRPSTVALYAAVLLTFALLKAWPAPACNNPVFAEIVPPRQRNLVYAFDRCFEGAIAACAAPLVGVLAERLFGFSGSGTVTHNPERDMANASALGNALLAFLVVPWCCNLTLYTGLHWTYPADKAAALRRQRCELWAHAHGQEERGVLIDRLSTAASSDFSVVELVTALPSPPDSRSPSADLGLSEGAGGSGGGSGSGDRAALLRRATGSGGGQVSAFV